MSSGALRLDRIPVRWRLTIATVAISGLALGGISLIMLLSFRGQLASSIRADLVQRSSDLAALVQRHGPAALGGREAADLLRPQGALAQVLDAGGGVVARSPNAPRAPLSPSRPASELTRPVPGVAEKVALTVRPLAGSSLLLVVGRSLEDQERADESMAKTLLIGGPLVLALVTLGAYSVAALALAPVDAMRRRASAMIDAPMSGRLPVSAARDELADLGTTLNTILDRMAAASEHERAFIAHASHELRTPLARLQAGIELSLADDSSDEELRRALAAAGREARRLGTLAGDLLALAALDHARGTIHREPVDVADLLSDLVRLARPGLEADGRCISLDCDPVVFEADHVALRRAVGNLIDNAWIHGEGMISVWAHARDGEVHVGVADEGAGLDLPIDEAVGRFVRGHNAGTRPGAGLGLALVDAVARAHGGSVQVVAGPPGAVVLRLATDAPARSRPS
jgi:signal transduction histidine kinase